MILDGVCNNPLCPYQTLLVLCFSFVFFQFWNVLFNEPFQIIFFENEHDPIFPCSEVIATFKLFVKLGVDGHLAWINNNDMLKLKTDGEPLTRCVFFLVAVGLAFLVVLGLDLAMLGFVLVALGLLLATLGLLPSMLELLLFAALGLLLVALGLGLCGEP